MNMQISGGRACQETARAEAMRPTHAWCSRNSQETSVLGQLRGESGGRWGPGCAREGLLIFPHFTARKTDSISLGPRSTIPEKDAIG